MLDQIDQQPDERLFPYERWTPQLEELSNTYRNNTPFPHIHLTDFLNEAVARQLVQEFPKPDDASWIQYKHYNENKLGKNERNAFPPLIGQIIDELNSPEFVTWLSELTGILNLKADTSLEGGGMHQTERGGFLNVHADFIMHHHRKNWHRKCNLILYLNEGWEEQWGGSLQLWDSSMKRCVNDVSPLFNHVLMFNTSATSFHGYPDPIHCPDGTTRKSLALYYYVVQSNSVSVPKSTLYHARPGDGFGRSLLIFCDNNLLRFYSFIKSTFGLSDGFASRILGAIFRKKK